MGFPTILFLVSELHNYVMPLSFLLILTPLYLKNRFRKSVFDVVLNTRTKARIQASMSTILLA